MLSHLPFDSRPSVERLLSPIFNSRDIDFRLSGMSFDFRLSDMSFDSRLSGLSFASVFLFQFNGVKVRALVRGLTTVRVLAIVLARLLAGALAIVLALLIVFLVVRKASVDDFLRDRDLTLITLAVLVLDLICSRGSKPLRLPYVRIQKAL